MQVAGRQLKVLVIYCSSAGHTRTIAEQVTKAAQADLEELRAAGEPSGTGARHYFWALRHLLLSQKPPLVPVEHDASTYDLIILAVPSGSARSVPCFAATSGQLLSHASTSHSSAVIATLQDSRSNMSPVC
jgi:hypothetical protein